MSCDAPGSTGSATGHEPSEFARCVEALARDLGLGPDAARRSAGAASPGLMPGAQSCMLTIDDVVFLLYLSDVNEPGRLDIVCDFTSPHAGGGEHVEAPVTLTALRQAMDLNHRLRGDEGFTLACVPGHGRLVGRASIAVGDHARAVLADRLRGWAVLVKTWRDMCEAMS